MPKPIFLIGLLNQENDCNSVDAHQKYFENKFPDYHVLVYVVDGTEIKFECFYEKDFNEVKYEELKQLVKDRLETLNIKL